MASVRLMTRGQARPGRSTAGCLPMPETIRAGGRKNTRPFRACFNPRVLQVLFRLGSFGGWMRNMPRVAARSTSRSLPRINGATSFEVVSGWRSPAINTWVNGASRSRHLEFKALDLVAANRPDRHKLYADLCALQRAAESKSAMGWAPISIRATCPATPKVGSTSMRADTGPGASIIPPRPIPALNSANPATALPPQTPRR